MLTLTSDKFVAVEFSLSPLTIWLRSEHAGNGVLGFGGRRVLHDFVKEYLMSKMPDAGDCDGGDGNGCDGDGVDGDSDGDGVDGDGGDGGDDD
jgi:hypothetical protein